MAQCDRNCVRSVIRFGNSLQMQQSAHHIHDLALFRLAVSYNSLLDLHGRVLRNVQPGLISGQQHHAAAMGDRDTGRDIIGKEQLLHRHFLGRKGGDQFLHIRINSLQTAG